MFVLKMWPAVPAHGPNVLDYESVNFADIVRKSVDPSSDDTPNIFHRFEIHRLGTKQINHADE